MEHGVSVGPFPGNVEDVPEKFDFVELSIGEQEVPPGEIDTEKLEKVLEEKDFDLVVHLPFRQPIATEVEVFNQALVDYFDQLLEFSKDLDVEKAVIHANMRDQDSGEELDILENRLEELLKLQQRHGIELCFENVRHVDTPELMELGALLDGAGASMCFDIGHAFISAEQEEVEEFLEKYSHLISHLHVHDIRERGDTHICVGEGEIDFEIVSEKLSGFDGTSCLEIFTGDVDYMELSHEKFLQHF